MKANPDPLRLSHDEATAQLAAIAKTAPQSSEGGLSEYKTLSFAAGLAEAGRRTRARR